MSSNAYIVERSPLLPAASGLAASGSAGSVFTSNVIPIARSSKFALFYAISGANPNIVVDYLVGRSAVGPFVKPSVYTSPNIMTISAEQLTGDIRAFDIDESATHCKIRFSNASGTTPTILWADLNHA
jgi:hypothetical protein